MQTGEQKKSEKAFAMSSAYCRRGSSRIFLFEKRENDL